MKKIDPSQIKKGGIYAIVSSFGAFDKVLAAAGDALGFEAWTVVPCILYYDEDGRHTALSWKLPIQECESVYQLTEREYKTVDDMFLNYNKKFFDFIQKIKNGN